MSANRPVFRLKPLSVHLSLALASLPLGSAFFYSPPAMAATCAAASNASNTVSASCEDLVWSNGNLNIDNNAVITATGMVLFPIRASGTLGDLTLSQGASVSSTNRGIRITLGGGGTSIGNININGQINANEAGIDTFGAGITIGTITNTGSIASANSHGIAVGSGVTVSTINNLTGTISGYNDPNDYASINNSGSIGTLNNGQSGLTYRGVAPTNYNIYITSTSNYGTLSVRGTNNFGVGAMNFGVAAGSTIRNNYLYAGVIRAEGSTTFDSTATKTGTFTTGGSTYNYSLQWNSTSSAWDLLFGVLNGTPSSEDTQTALQAAASALRAVYKLQANAINASLAHDCTEFGKNQFCISGGGRLAISNNFSGDKFSTLLVAAYQTQDKLRVGAFVDQNALSTTANGMALSKSPIYGVFGVWHQNPDTQGLALRLAASFADPKLKQTRDVTGTSEAGMGQSSLKSQALTAELSYAHPFAGGAWLAQPYLGLRQSSLERGAYTESNGISAPLSFASLKQTQTTALAGVRMSKPFANGLQINGQLGLEQALNTRGDPLQASGLSGLTDTEFSGSTAKTRPTASLGASYATAKNQRLNLSVLYRAESLRSSSHTTGLLTYQIGL